MATTLAAVLGGSNGSNVSGGVIIGHGGLTVDGNNTVSDVAKDRDALRLVPLDRSQARIFIAKHHRHNKPPSVDVIRVGVARGETLVGVAMAARPLSRNLCDGTTLEVSRTCTDGSRNVNSMLYGAIARAAAALGYRKLITYTLASEPGSSLRASGFIADGIRDHDPKGWESQRTSRSMPRDLFGTRTTPDEAKQRWVRILR
jgi:hypothetical protein